jgi:2',3'-cyclic-nucleotide 2'-phosphodiesterase (5'-nucleotidase family)
MAVAARWTAPARRRRWTLPVVCALGLAAWTWPALGSHGQVTISVVGTTDLHGRIAATSDGRGGLDWLGGYLANLRAARAADGGAVILLDAGDTFQGGVTSNLSEGAVVIDAYNALGYTALAVGNHDLEFGAEDQWVGARTAAPDLRGALKARAAQARFPFLAANLVDTATGRPVAWPNVRPSVVVEAAGVRVGIVGVMTLGALAMTLTANVHGLSVSPLVGAIERESTALRAAGTPVVIVVAHAGGACTDVANPADLSTCDDGAEMFEVARRLPRGLVDLMVTGHTHATVAHVVHGIPMVQADYWGQAFSRVDLTVNASNGAIEGRRIFPPQAVCARAVAGAAGCVPAAKAPAGEEAAYEGRPVRPDAAIARAMAPELRRVDALRAVPVGAVLDVPLRRGDGGDESPLANLFADALRAAVPDADVAVSYGVGPGGLRTELPAGPLTRGALYDVFPFDNRVARLELSGAALTRLLTDQIGRTWWRGRAFGVSGMVVTVGCRDGGQTVAVAHPSGRPLHDDERIVVASTDFMTTRFGGVDGAAVRVLDLQARDALEHWVRGAGELPASRFADPSRPRWISRCEAAP